MKDRSTPDVNALEAQHIKEGALNFQLKAFLMGSFSHTQTIALICRKKDSIIELAYLFISSDRGA